MCMQSTPNEFIFQIHTSEIIGKKIGDNSTHKRIDEASGESDEKASYLENSDEESKKGARHEETD